MHSSHPLQKPSFSRFIDVPADFPRPYYSVSGMQPKFSSVAYGARYYPPGCTPPIIYERWEICEDVARQVAKKAKEDKRARKLGMGKTTILANYLERLLKSDRDSADEIRWTIRRAAEILGCIAPETAECEPVSRQGTCKLYSSTLRLVAGRHHENPR